MKEEDLGIEEIEEQDVQAEKDEAEGKEADIVFVLKCNMRTFPMTHPDNRLFGIFGENEKKVLAEEKRLFYVALTRAKNKVFMLAEKEDVSPFLEEVGIHL